MILGKPSGISLEEHNENVRNEGNNLLRIFSRTNEKYSVLTGKSLTKRLLGAITFHDLGKVESVWQVACKKDFDLFQGWSKHNNGTFKDFSKQCPDICGRNLQQAGIRHEIFSLIRTKDKGISEVCQIAIAAHHSKLGKKDEKRWVGEGVETFSKELWKNFQRLNGEFKNRHYFRDAVLKHFEYAGVRSMLQIADRRASAREAQDAPLPFKEFDYKFRHNSYRKVQELVLENAEEELLLLRAPTGAGKTDACLLWANEQIRKGKAERLVIAMPTRFTSNALSINVSQSLADTGVYHSSAWHNRFKRAISDGKIERTAAKKEHDMARSLLPTVTVCTIDHLLMALTLTREEHHTTLFNLANSCLVVDEADFYDTFTQANILVLLEALNVLKVPVMIMSASIPEISLDAYLRTGYKIKGILEDKSKNALEKCVVKSILKYENVQELEEILTKCLAIGNAIIYANTVAKATEYYNWFRGKNVEPIIYHSRFTEPHKVEQEKRLIEALGSEAWKNKSANGIAILTQIGEMSVNISADIMISEICPIDRLVQRAGRLCRFDDHKVGDLYLLLPQKNDSLYPAPYGTFNKKENAWIPNEALLKTIAQIKCSSYSPGKFVDIINTVYSSVSYSEKAEENANKLKSLFVSNIVVLPLAISEEDESDAGEWKSRDMGVNASVFTKIPPYPSFYSPREFQEFKLEYAVDVPVYVAVKGFKENLLQKIEVQVANEVQSIYLCVEGIYDPLKGLNFSYDNFL